VSASKGAASAAPEFPRTLAAAQKAEGDLWAIADAVLFEVGPPSAHGVKDGSRARIEECSRFLADRGFEYSSVYLLDLRDTARSFPEGARDLSCTFTAHKMAGSPGMLAEAIRRNGGPPSRRFVERLRREFREAEEAAERKREQEMRRRAEEKAAVEREKVRRARDAEERRKAEERAERARQRAEQARREAEEAERKRQERRRKEAEAKATRIAKDLEDRDVAEALADDKSLGARRVTNAVHEREARRRRKAREENERQRDAGAMPLPAFVPKMIEDIGGWATGMHAITDDDLASLPADDRLVAHLRNVVEDLTVEALRWSTALQSGSRRGLPELEVIEGRASA
jgi:hypothetical protein